MTSPCQTDFDKKINIAVIFLCRVLIAFILDIVLTLALVIVALHISGDWYNSHHAIQNPVERGDDLGISIFGFYWGGVVFIFSFPVLFLFLFKITKTIFNASKDN